MSVLVSRKRCPLARHRALVMGPGPNPALNRTPAGGLSPARRSPVSLLR